MQQGGRSLFGDEAADAAAQAEEDDMDDTSPFLFAREGHGHQRPQSHPPPALAPLPASDFTQSTLVKFREKGKVPCKLLLNIVVLLLLVGQALTQVASSRADDLERRRLSSWLLATARVDGTTTTSSSDGFADGDAAAFSLYTRGAVWQAMAAVLQRYHSMAGTATVRLLPSADAPPALTVTQSRHSFRLRPLTASCEPFAPVGGAPQPLVQWTVQPSAADTSHDALVRLLAQGQPAASDAASASDDDCAPRRDPSGDWYAPCLPATAAAGPASNLTGRLLDDGALCHVALRLRIRRSLEAELSSSSSDVFRHATYLFHPELACARQPDGSFRCTLAMATTIQRRHRQPVLAVALLAVLAVACGVDVALRVKSIAKVQRFRRQACQQVEAEGAAGGSRHRPHDAETFLAFGDAYEGAHAPAVGMSAVAAAAVGPLVGHVPPHSSASPREGAADAAASGPPEGSEDAVAHVSAGVTVDANSSSSSSGSPPLCLPPSPSTAAVAATAHDGAGQAYDAAWRAGLLKDLGVSWHYWAIACHLCALGYVVLATGEAFEATVSADAAATKRIVLGCACFASSLQFLGFLRFFRRVYFLIKVTRRSMPRLLAVLAAAVPLFVGAVCFVTIVFGSQCAGRPVGSGAGCEFSTFAGTATALFTAAFGDSLLRAYDSAVDSSGSLSGGSSSTRAVLLRSLARVGLTVYIFAFMAAILNVALAVAMDVFDELQQTFGVATNGDGRRRAAAGHAGEINGTRGGTTGDPPHRHPPPITLVPPEAISAMAFRRRVAVEQVLLGLQTLQALASEAEAAAPAAAAAAAIV